MKYIKTYEHLLIYIQRIPEKLKSMNLIVIAKLEQLRTYIINIQDIPISQQDIHYLS